MSERSRSLLFLGASNVLLVVALSACGGGAADATTSAATDDAFAECMRDQGVDLPAGQFQAGVGVTPDQAPDGTMLAEPPRDVTRPDVTGPAASIDDESFEAARDACEDLLPEGAVMFGGPGGAGVDASAFGAYRSCMADHGLELPEPGEAGDPPASVDRDRPEFAAAQDVCALLLPDVSQTVPPTTVA